MLPFKGSAIEKELQGKFTIKHNFQQNFTLKKVVTTSFCQSECLPGVLQYAFCSLRQHFVLAYKCVKSCYLTTVWGGYKLARYPR